MTKVFYTEAEKTKPEPPTYGSLPQGTLFKWDEHNEWIFLKLDEQKSVNLTEAVHCDGWSFDDPVHIVPAGSLITLTQE